MIRRPPRSTRTDTLFPYTTLFRSGTSQRRSLLREQLDQRVDVLALERTNVGPYDFFDVLVRSEEHTSELQSLMRISYAVFCLKKKKLKCNMNNDNDTCNYTHKYPKTI